jgi:uncharacterized protein (DUF58 family)
MLSIFLRNKHFAHVFSIYWAWLLILFITFNISSNLSIIRFTVDGAIVVEVVDVVVAVPVMVVVAVAAVVVDSDEEEIGKEEEEIVKEEEEEAKEEEAGGFLGIFTFEIFICTFYLI